MLIEGRRRRKHLNQLRRARTTFGAGIDSFAYPAEPFDQSTIPQSLSIIAVSFGDLLPLPRETGKVAPSIEDMQVVGKSRPAALERPGHHNALDNSASVTSGRPSQTVLACE